MNGINPNMIQMVVQDRQREILHEAADILLSKQAKNGQHHRNHRILAVLANTLIRIGEHLKNAAESSTDINPQSV